MIVNKYDYAFIYWTPEPLNVVKRTLKKLHKLLDTLAFPNCFRYDFQWLKRHLPRDNQQHPNFQKAMLILNFLTF